MQHSVEGVCELWFLGGNNGGVVGPRCVKQTCLDAFAFPGENVGTPHRNFITSKAAESKSGA